MAQHFLDRYDQDVVKNLMPLIVNVLESLDLAYTESSEFDEIQMPSEYFSEAFHSRRSVLYQSRFAQEARMQLTRIPLQQRISIRRSCI